MGGRDRAAVRHAAVFGLLLGILAAVLTATSASAQPAPMPVPVYHWYAGVGAGGVHHTGFVPNTNNMYNMEKYQPGAKAYVGYWLNNIFALELGFDYLGSNSFYEGFPTLSTERSFAVTGTALVFSPPVSQWLMPTLVPVRAYARGGFAFKDIHQQAFDGTFNEGILSFVVGGGAEFEITPRWFMRAEYEFISSALGGPSEPFTALNGLFTADFGGTNRVVNAMHTEIFISGGVRF